MPKVLIVFSTVDGQTRRICERIRLSLERRGHEVVLADIVDALDADWDTFDKIVVGASIRYGRHRPVVYRFIERHLRVLRSRPCAFFSVNVVARKPGKDTPTGNPYMRAFLRRSPWKPDTLAVFAGRIDYPTYRRMERLVIRFIMWLTHGPTDPRSRIEFTDWSAVDAFAERVAAP